MEPVLVWPTRRSEGFQQDLLSIFDPYQVEECRLAISRGVLAPLVPLINSLALEWKAIVSQSAVGCGQGPAPLVQRLDQQADLPLPGQDGRTGRLRQPTPALTVVLLLKRGAIALTVRHDCARVARLGPYQVDLKTWEVTSRRSTVRLPEKSFLVLAALLERPGEAVTREELRERLWPDGTIVDFDNNLNSAVATLRSVFEDSAKSQAFIQTLPRLGYRLAAEVSFDQASASVPERDVRPSRSRGRSWTLVLAVGAVTLAWIAAVWPREQRIDSAPLKGPARVVEAPRDPAARQAWQHGLYLLGRGSNGDRARALESFRKTGELEPGFASAWAKVAETLSEMSFAGTIEIRAGLVEAREAARHALSINPASSAAHRILALAYLHLDWDFAAAAREIESALRLDPNDGQSYLAAATFLSVIGLNQEAVLAARRAVELDPASYLLKSDLAYFLVAARQYAEAMAVCEEVLLLEPRSITALAYRIAAGERLGQFEEAASAARRIMELRGASEGELRSFDRQQPPRALSYFREWELADERSKASQSSVRLARRHASLHQKDEAMRFLEQAYEQEEPWLLYLNGYAQFDNLRHDHRFERFVARLGFPSPTDRDLGGFVSYLEGLF